MTVPPLSSYESATNNAVIWATSDGSTGAGIQGLMPAHESHLEIAAREKNAEVPKMGIVRRMIPVRELSIPEIIARQQVTDD
jgi:hypothetical protein